MLFPAQKPSVIYKIKTSVLIQFVKPHCRIPKALGLAIPRCSSSSAKPICAYHQNLPCTFSLGSSSMSLGLSLLYPLLSVHLIPATLKALTRILPLPRRLPLLQPPMIVRILFYFPELCESYCWLDVFLTQSCKTIYLL